jgi:hypothetical protein
MDYFHYFEHGWNCFLNYSDKQQKLNTEDIMPVKKGTTRKSAVKKDASAAKKNNKARPERFSGRG